MNDVSVYLNFEKLFDFFKSVAYVSAYIILNTNMATSVTIAFFKIHEYKTAVSYNN